MYCCAVAQSEWMDCCNLGDGRMHKTQGPSSSVSRERLFLKLRVSSLPHSAGSCSAFWLAADGLKWSPIDGWNPVWTCSEPVPNMIWPNAVQLIKNSVRIYFVFYFKFWNVVWIQWMIPVDWTGWCWSHLRSMWLTLASQYIKGGVKF